MTHNQTPTIITSPAEQRQIAKVLHFPAQFAPYIDWENVARDARELGAHFEARYTNDGACTITFFWSYDADEV